MDSIRTTITGGKFDPNEDIPDLSGKVFLITGGSAGIGFGIVAHTLQHNPAKILLLSNKKEHADSSMEELKEWGDVSKVEWVQCDLENFKQVDQVAKSIKEKEKRLDVLVVNAGIGVGVYNETVDGVDSHMQVNVFSQMHLILTLLPLLQRTTAEHLTPTRIAVQSSDLHRILPSTGIEFANMAEINQDIGPSYLYNRSKLALILMVRALERRRKAGQLGWKPSNDDMYINATHPGGVATDQQYQAEEAYGLAGKLLHKATRPLLKDPVTGGCLPILFAATSDEIVKEKIQGSYIVPDKKPTDPSSQAMDEKLGEQFWKLSTGLLNEKIGANWS